MDSTRMSAIEALRKRLDLFDVDQETKCWHWRGNFTKKGYPRFKHKGRWYGTRSLVFSSKNPMDSRFFLTMTCRNRDCVNPQHMEQTKARPLSNTGEQS